MFVAPTRQKPRLPDAVSNAKTKCRPGTDRPPPKAKKTSKLPTSLHLGPARTPHSNLLHRHHLDRPESREAVFFSIAFARPELSIVHPRFIFARAAASRDSTFSTSIPSTKDQRTSQYRTHARRVCHPQIKPTSSLVPFFSRPPYLGIRELAVRSVPHIAIRSP